MGSGIGFMVRIRVLSLHTALTYFLISSVPHCTYQNKYDQFDKLHLSRL